jgi:hypothetical protein
MCYFLYGGELSGYPSITGSHNMYPVYCTLFSSMHHQHRLSAEVSKQEIIFFLNVQERYAYMNMRMKILLGTGVAKVQ